MKDALIKSSLLYGSETCRLTENNKRRVEATEMDALRRASRISRKDRVKNVTIRQQIVQEETIIKEIEQNQLTWYGHVQWMAEGRLPKIALKWIPKQKRARGRLKKNWMEVTRKAINERNLNNEGQWEDRKQWSLGVGQRRKTFWNIYIYIYTGYCNGAAEGSYLPAGYAVCFGEQRRFFLDCVILKRKALRAIETSGTIH